MSGFGSVINQQKARAVQTRGEAPFAGQRALEPSPLASSSGSPMVQSVFNVPPVGAISIAPSGGVLAFLDAPNGADEEGSFSYRVQAGKVFLLRAIEYFFYPIYPDSSLLQPITPKFFADGQAEDVFQDTGKLQATGLVEYFKAFTENTEISIVVRRLSSVTWTNRYSAFPPAIQAALAPSFNARLVGQLLPLDSLPVEKAQATRFVK